MKWMVIFSTILLLQACSSFDARLSNIKVFNKVPHSWHVSGRLGASFNGEHQNAGFEVDFNGSNYKLILLGALGLGQILIESNAQGLSIDGEPIILSFKQWMIEQAQWYFPVHDLGKIVFNQPFLNANWQLKILSRHPNGLPKSIRLIHTIRDINIKLKLNSAT